MCIFTDALLRTSDNEPMIDFDFRMLHAKREPLLDMIEIIAPKLFSVLPPWTIFVGITFDLFRRNVFVECGLPFAVHPPAVHHELVLYDHRQARSPRHLMGRLLNVENI